MLSSRQIKAGRMLLDWTGEDLARETGLSITTIRNLETGDSPRKDTLNKVREAFERRGVEFSDGDGVKRRSDEIKVFRGLHSCDEFFDDMLQTVKGHNQSIVANFNVFETFISSCNVRNGSLGNLEVIAGHAIIHCLLPEPADARLISPSFEFRLGSQHSLGPASYFVYGRKHAIVRAEDNATCQFIVFDSFTTAHDYRMHFTKLWHMADPFIHASNLAQKHVAA